VLPWTVLDDLFLRAQHGLDRLIRRLRLGRRPVPGRRRFLVVQIDGLSRSVLEKALDRGLMPFLRRFLSRGAHRLAPMSVGIPTSTPAFHMTVMYGRQPDIPGFHYHDKRRGTDIHFIRGGHAAFVEADQAGTCRGILRGGSVYGCVFTGGAEHDFFSFAGLTRPRASGLVRVLSAWVVVGWVAVKCAALTGQESVRTLGRMLRRPHHWDAEWRWLKKKVAISVWTREWFTAAVARDTYDGVPAIYVNYLDYDETAHAFGPGSRRALATLRGIDSSLRQIWRVLRRVPEYRYDLYVLADHGQASCAPYQAVTGGQRFEQAFFDQVARDRNAGPGARTSPDPPRGLPAERAAGAPAPGAPAHRSDPQALSFEPYLDVRESCERDGIRVVSAGPNAFVYFLDTPEPVLLEAIEARRPGLMAALSKSPGVGFVLARSAAGPVCFWRGESHPLDGDGGPFAAREDREIVTQGLAALMAMPSAGDLVVYGIGAPEGHVSYIDEIGGHAGPSAEELHTFLVAPIDAGLPTRIDHPRQLYDVFIRYRSDEPEESEADLGVKPHSENRSRR
jgi:Type I phosphodiesterase / nucleotide pyrophosphatase